jgi:hypothetical protein
MNPAEESKLCNCSLSRAFAKNINIDSRRKSANYYWQEMKATSHKVAGSILDEAIGFSNVHNPSSRAMVLGSTQSLTEISSKNLSGGKGRPARKADNLTPSVSRLSRKCGSFDVSQPYGSPQPVTGIALSYSLFFKKY